MKRNGLNHFDRYVILHQQGNFSNTALELISFSTTGYLLLFKNTLFKNHAQCLCGVPVASVRISPWICSKAQCVKNHIHVRSCAANFIFAKNTCSPQTAVCTIAHCDPIDILLWKVQYVGWHWDQTSSPLSAHQNHTIIHYTCVAYEILHSPHTEHFMIGMHSKRAFLLILIVHLGWSCKIMFAMVQDK